MNTKIIRIFNTYGPRMRMNDGRAIPAFMTQSLRNKPVTVYGDGSQTRSFCYIDDLVEGIFRLAISRHSGPMNIGNPQELSLLDMARTIVKLTRSKSRIVHQALPTDDPKVRQPDITLARRQLGWSPSVDLPTGLRKTIRYFRTRLAQDRR
jgi:dTDP-glucose 4,6-dehydratase